MLELSWTDNSSDEEGFEIERSTDGGSNFTLISTTLWDVESYVDADVLPATEYCYRLRAVNAGGSSDYTGTECGTTQLTETLLLQWDGPIEQSDHGFAQMIESHGNLPDSTQQDWSIPPYFGDGSVHVRAELRSTPAGVNGHLSICKYQTLPGDDYIYGIENCGTRFPFTSNTPGGATLTATTSYELASMWEVNGVPIDWGRVRTGYSVVVWDENVVNVTDWLDLNWAGHDPEDWYPMDLRFTAVVVAPGASFSGWQNYP